MTFLPIVAISGTCKEIFPRLKGRLIAGKLTPGKDPLRMPLTRSPREVSLVLSADGVYRLVRPSRISGVLNAWVHCQREWVGNLRAEIPR